MRDLAPDDRAGIRFERHAQAGIEAFDRFDQSEITDLFEIVRASGRARELTRHGFHERHMSDDEAVAKLAGPGRPVPRELRAGLARWLWHRHRHAASGCCR